MAQSASTSGRGNWLNPLGEELSLGGRLWRLLALLAVLYLLVAPVVMWVEYRRAFPDFFDPTPGADQPAPPAGTIYTETLVTMSNQMLESWLPNDKVYPTIFLDNPQNFQLGELELVRYAVRVLRDKLSRQRTTDKIDPHVDQAFTYFSNNPDLWLFPAAEAKFAKGAESLEAYKAQLAQGKSFFYPRADNLIELLDQLTSLLGGANTRLGNAPRDVGVRLSEETAGDRYSSGETLQKVQTPWNKVDDNFYFSRGVAYGLWEVLVAVRWEFREVLKIKNSTELLDNVINELELAQFEPLMVFNGDRDGLFANHSLSLMATLEGVRQKLLNIQSMLER